MPNLVRQRCDGIEFDAFRIQQWRALKARDLFAAFGGKVEHREPRAWTFTNLDAVAPEAATCLIAQKITFDHPIIPLPRYHPRAIIAHLTMHKHAGTNKSGKLKHPTASHRLCTLVAHPNRQNPQHYAAPERIEANQLPSQQYPSALDTLSNLLSSDESFPPAAINDYVSAFPSEATSSKESFLEHIRQLTASDSKASELKSLQGFLWRTGFENGSLQAPLYADVPLVLRRWRTEGKKLAIFSSGSVNAQKLFLAYTGIQGLSQSNVAVDLNPLFNAYFDTVNAGAKGEKASYEKIAAALSASEKNTLFLSDNVTEVRAAIAAGMKALVVDRPGNAPVSDQEKTELELLTSLEDIELD